MAVCLLAELCESCFAARIESEQKEKLNYERAKLRIRMVPSTFAQDDQDFQDNGVSTSHGEQC